MSVPLALRFGPGSNIPVEETGFQAAEGGIPCPSGASQQTVFHLPRFSPERLLDYVTLNDRLLLQGGTKVSVLFCCTVFLFLSTVCLLFPSESFLRLPHQGSTLAPLLLSPWGWGGSLPWSPLLTFSFSLCSDILKAMGAVVEGTAGLLAANLPHLSRVCAQTRLEA